MLRRSWVRNGALALFCALALVSSDVRSDPPPATAPAEPGSSAATPRSVPPNADRLPALDNAARAIGTNRALEGASVGIAVLDVDSGRMLAAFDEHLALNPASNAKLYTAGAALATLHGEHRYETVLTGKLEGDSVAGPLSVRGYGDP
jgi:D-alanyl-D-alanine carboxypeptidase/D-alanyl-D-alanine-endopeptidase (penicillin-binding protein 4)